MTGANCPSCEMSVIHVRGVTWKRPAVGNEYLIRYGDASPSPWLENSSVGILDMMHHVQERPELSLGSG